MNSLKFFLKKKTVHNKIILKQWNKFQIFGKLVVYVYNYFWMVLISVGPMNIIVLYNIHKNQSNIVWFSNICKTNPPSLIVPLIINSLFTIVPLCYRNFCPPLNDSHNFHYCISAKYKYKSHFEFWKWLRILVEEIQDIIPTKFRRCKKGRMIKRHSV